MLVEAFSSNLYKVQGVQKVGINFICVLFIARKMYKILIYAENPSYKGSQKQVERIMNV